MNLKTLSEDNLLLLRLAGKIANSVEIDLQKAVKENHGRVPSANVVIPFEHLGVIVAALRLLISIAQSESAESLDLDIESLMQDINASILREFSPAKQDA